MATANRIYAFGRHRTARTTIPRSRHNTLEIRRENDRYACQYGTVRSSEGLLLTGLRLQHLPPSLDRPSPSREAGIM